MSIDRNYISEMDKFLAELETKPGAMSESRQQEQEKYDKINRLRDEEDESAKTDKIWKDF